MPAAATLAPSRVAVFAGDHDDAAEVTAVACGRTVHLVGRRRRVEPRLAPIPAFAGTAGAGIVRSLSLTPPSGATAAVPADTDEFDKAATATAFSPDGEVLYVAVGTRLKRGVRAAVRRSLVNRFLNLPRSRKSLSAVGDALAASDEASAAVSVDDSTDNSAGGTIGVEHDLPSADARCHGVVALCATTATMAYAPLTWPASALPTRDGAPTCLAIAPSGDLLVCGCDDGCVRGWLVDPKSVDVPACIFTVSLQGGAVTAVSVSPDGLLVAAATLHGGDVTVLDASSGRTAAQLPIEAGLGSASALSLAFVASPTYVLAIGCSDGHIHEYTASDIDGPWTADGQHVDLCGSEKAALTSPVSHYLQPPPEQQPHRVSHLASDARGRVIALAPQGAGLVLGVNTTHPKSRLMSVVDANRVACADVSAIGDRVVCGTDDGNVELVDVASISRSSAAEGARASPPRALAQRRKRAAQARGVHHSSVRSVRFSPHGQLVASVGADGSLCVHAVTDVMRARSIDLPSPPSAVHVHDDGRLVAWPADASVASATAHDVSDSLSFDLTSSPLATSARPAGGNLIANVQTEAFATLPSVGDGDSACMACVVA